MTKKSDSERELLNKIEKVNEKMIEINKSPIKNEKNKLIKNISLKSLLKRNVNNKKPKLELFEKVILFVNMALICCLIGYLVGTKIKLNNDYQYTKADKEVQSFIDQYNYILNNYYGDIDKNNLITSAINGMLQSLDDYSGVIDNTSNSFTITLDGTYEGIGITVSNNILGQLMVVSVYEDTPAFKAGIKAGDFLTKFNDISLEGMTSAQFVNLVSQNKSMDLVLLREAEEIKVTLTKEKITLKSVNSHIIDNKIGYINITIFANNTYDQFKEILDEVENKGIKKLIIDLRSNSGGHLSSVEDMLSLFFDNHHVIYQTEDSNGTSKVYSKGKTNRDFEIVILQDSESASASEILAASLKENLNAYIIGKNSYGKGTVQQLQSVGDIQYKFTTKKWLTPNGNWIEGVGIKPDLEVDLGNDYKLNPILENDLQYQEAIKHFK